MTHTCKHCVLELQRTRSIRGSSEDSGILFENEIRVLDAEQKQQLLPSAEIKLTILSPTQVLAIKYMIGMPCRHDTGSESLGK